MNATRHQAITSYLKRTDWTHYAANGYIGVAVGRLSFYFVFDDQDQITNVILD